MRVHKQVRGWKQRIVSGGSILQIAEQKQVWDSSFSQAAYNEGPEGRHLQSRRALRVRSYRSLSTASI